MNLLQKERRKTQRIPCNMHVAYKVIRRGLEPCEDNRFVKCQTKDISEFGLGFIVNEQFLPGDIIRVDFTLGGRLLEVVCEVMWNNEIILGEIYPQYLLGVEFSCLTAEEQRYLEGYFRMRFESIWDFLLNPQKRLLGY